MSVIQKRTWKDVERKEGEQLPASMRCVINIFNRDNPFTIKEIKEACGVSRATASDTVRYLDRSGTIRTVGVSKTGATQFRR